MKYKLDVLVFTLHHGRLIGGHTILDVLVSLSMKYFSKRVLYV